jgi:cytochrome d ubiquinol oxidase subunit I
MESASALAGISLVLRWRRRLYDHPEFLRAAVAFGPAGFVAVLAGWVTTEVGRQPFTIYGLMRTAESVSPIGAPGVAGSLAAFVVVYLIVFGVGTLYILRLMGRSPGEGPPAEREPVIRTAGMTPGPAMKAPEAPAGTYEGVP